MTRADAVSWNVGELPFLWNPLPTPHNPDGLPDVLPFTLVMNPGTGALVQAPMPEVTDVLARAYAMGSMITGQMDERGIGRRYADDFLDFMGARDEGPSPFRGQRVLDIGCGNGYLLHRLAKQGAEVLGLEPGEHGQARFDVPVIRDFFPSSQLSGTFDAIVLFGVVEHVEQPVEFMEQVLALLEPGGTVFIGVPDCAPYIEAGDLSCLIHEHWSYFDDRSLARTLQLAGGGEMYVQTSGFGGLLYARVRRAGGPSWQADPGFQASRLHVYRALAMESIQRIGGYLDRARSSRESVGVYVPGRIINALFAGAVDRGDWRFFDDNPLLSGTFFPGMPVPIEGRPDLLARPTDHVLVMSRSFGNAIASALRRQLPPSTTISTWHDFFASNAAESSL